MAFSINDGQGPNVLAVAAVMISLSTIAVGLRVWSRFVRNKAGLWWDDWLSLAALPCVLVVCASSIYATYLGLGQHIIHVHIATIKFGIVTLIFEVFYNSALTLIKLSVLLFYTRIFRTVGIYRALFWVVGLMLIAWWVGVNGITIFPCHPVRKVLDPGMPGHCINQETNFVATGIVNIVTDIILLLLPVPMLWSLHTGIRRRIYLVGLFTAGYLIPVLSIVRLLFIAREGGTFDKDITWNSVTSTILVILEVSIALISSCIPSISNLAKHSAESFTRLSNKDGSNPNYKAATARRDEISIE